MQLERRPNNDDRASGVVHSLAQQILAEATLFTLDHVSQRLQLPAIGAGDGFATATIIEQRVDRFLQHALFVAHNDIRRVEIQ